MATAIFLKMLKQFFLTIIRVFYSPLFLFLLRGPTFTNFLLVMLDGVCDGLEVLIINLTLAICYRLVTSGEIPFRWIRKVMWCHISLF